MLLADQRKAFAPAAGGNRMKPQWRWFAGGVLITLGMIVLAMIFLAYQAPELLLDWANLRYCG